MARIRSIKPEFWTSAQVMDCSATARLLFIGLWNFCDDFGRHPLNAKQIKALVFPADDISASEVSRMIDELSANGLIIKYTVDNKEFFQVTGWHHQKIDRPQPPKYPQPNPPVDEHSENVRRMVSTERIGEERIGEEKKKDAAAVAAHLVPPPPSPVPHEAPDARVYRRGREVLGNSAGGIVKMLILAKDGNPSLAAAAIETASTKADPKAYLMAIVNSRQKDSEKERLRNSGDAW